MPSPTPGTATQIHSSALLNLLIAIWLIALATAVVLPSFRQYVLKSNRAIAKAALEEVLDQEQAYYAKHQRYGDLRALGYSGTAAYVSANGSISEAASSSAIYRLSILPAGSDLKALCAIETRPADAGLVLGAQPIQSQLGDDDCGSLCLSTTGLRAASGPKGAQACWSGGGRGRARSG
jgi:type IV pilus assembly protein PilE